MDDLKHSGLGIASFVVAILSGVLMFVVVIIAGIMESSTPDGIDENSAGAILIGFFIIAFFFTSLVALGLGIGGLVQKQRKKVLAVLGTVFATLTLLVTTFVIVIGLTMG